MKITLPSNISDDVVVRVYAVSHNVLVFSHGLAGLKFWYVIVVMSPGRINLHVMGLVGDVDIKYDYSYFTKFIKRNAHFAKEYRNLHSEGEFGGMCEFRIPMNTGIY